MPPEEEEEAKKLLWECDRLLLLRGASFTEDWMGNLELVGVEEGMLLSSEQEEIDEVGRRAYPDAVPGETSPTAEARVSEVVSWWNRHRNNDLPERQVVKELPVSGVVATCRAVRNADTLCLVRTRGACR